MTKGINSHTIRDLDQHAALRSILEGTATATGERFFYTLVEHLAHVLHTCGAWVTEYLEERERLRALAMIMDGEFIEGFEYDVIGTPCEAVIKHAELTHHPDRLLELFPDSKNLKAFGTISFLGAPLQDVDGRVLGHLAVLDRRPMPEDPDALALFRIFAGRAAAELQRLRLEQDLRDRERKLGRLVDSVMDGIVELDANLRVTLMNPAAQRAFRGQSHSSPDTDFSHCLTAESISKLQSLMSRLDQSDNSAPPYLWIQGGLEARDAEGNTFPAEATLSRSEMQREAFFTLVLRNVNDRIEAEKRIQTLTLQTEYLQEELKALHNFDQIIGRSDVHLQVLKDAARVADTNATVLILGETGTGKELIARAIHAASARRDGPLVRVNCAAIPPDLLEAEFFGHTAGAFTGATGKREGRFAIADRGTIFLDEIGELPPDVQGKLLRVLQEGEFEPVGSSRTRRVDVRVLAATNRNLYQAVTDGHFREDLYYRLNVFPIELPPLRDRGDDVLLLAEAFIERFCTDMGRSVQSLSDECKRRLKAYHWPGNVRELENVIERAVIISGRGPLTIGRALPDPPANEQGDSIEEQPAPHGIRTQEELSELERENMYRALESAGWRIEGERGAAELLGMKPSTLRSRMKALDVRRRQ